MKELTHYLTGSCEPLSEKDLLSADCLKVVLEALPGWASKKDSITRQFSFNNFHQTMAFVNAVAWIAHQQDHHPDVTFGYNSCEVTFSTHSAGGVTRNDTLCASGINELLSVGSGKPE